MLEFQHFNRDVGDDTEKLIADFSGITAVIVGTKSAIHSVGVWGTFAFGTAKNWEITVGTVFKFKPKTRTAIETPDIFFHRNFKLMHMLARFTSLVSGSALVSTLGGGYFLCKNIAQARKMAERQIRIARDLGDEGMALRCHRQSLLQLQVGIPGGLP